MVIPFILVVYGELASNHRSEKARFFYGKMHRFNFHSLDVLQAFHPRIVEFGTGWAKVT